MDHESVRQHWANWAATHGADLKATTRTWTAKALEVDALRRRLGQLSRAGALTRILEVGCGNGINCVELSKAFPSARFDGVDYIADMVRSAGENARQAGVGERVTFRAGDVLKLEDVEGLGSAYDVVFTDRCLINLRDVELQKQAISALARRVRPGGHLIMIENSTTTHGAQNRAREHLGLEARRPAEFNLFFDEGRIRPHLAAAGLELADVEDFSSLHDLVLYVLLPAVNGGKLDYEHPLVEAAARLSQAVSGETPNAFGAFGQNRMFVCRKL